ncbi:hypothetical protein GUITHDRAFT_150237 [Guillardia theta CCMP2712]|uniref:Uncharacterized protein n=1 Tax=Guillardia theta (strain CCMP2712) TaxID=905079 RepID=L1JZI5_GUITC|nr:hypothetical protein GUITHDRAFT_150237 [Guillardia theta CCMP2712]EKX53620.1 hypothetical protein GUITHDRAFT_150237 [Guillardia theta CCMP2712]|mmetsp:Transcript_33363/g.105204  ORF Transcript_33363/g.105204 Transcript_33363/m.105204 type:complete len:156 (-) Transcript_33363:565-1032(-)|eukprot:XP_005840600.1 hypothetical protein GUITHDRAFT_150237 [Guillardia theta CCMP2712]
MSGMRKLSSFSATEIASNEFRDALNATVDMLCRAIQQQSVQIKELKSRIEELEKKETKNAGARQQEWQSFQWLFDTVSSDDEDTDSAMKGKKRKRKSGGKGASFSDDGEEDAAEGEDTDDADDGNPQSAGKMKKLKKDPAPKITSPTGAAKVPGQ